MVNSRYFLGCPVWGSDAWKGTLFTQKCSRGEMLRQYSRVFNSVEGNSVFYGMPSADTISRWIETSSPGFRFVLKFPRVISHEKQLVDVQQETREFLRILEQLAAGDRLGPSFLQLSPHFSPAELEALDHYLAALPREFEYAIEVRHNDFFDQAANEQRLIDLLRRHYVSNVMLDSRPLFAHPAADESEKISQGRKPRTPVRSEPVGNHPVLRLIGRNDVGSLELWAESWSKVIARWITQGATPYVFAHTPNEAFAPAFGRLLHAKMQTHLPDLPPLSTFAGEEERDRRETQQRLF